MVDPEVRNEVPDEEVGPAEVVAEIDEDGGSDGDAEVAEEDQLGILSLVEGAAGVEVVDAVEKAVLLALAAALALALVVVVAGNVGQEVVGPADELLGNEHEQGDDGGLLAELGQLVGKAAEAGGLLLAGLGHEDHVALHVAGGLVVLAVGDLPAEVGHEQGRVEDPADGVVKDLGGAEGLVAALVGQHPHAGAEEALGEGVEGPEQGAQGRRGDVLGRHVRVEEVESGAETHDVAGDVVEAGGGRAFEAVLGDGIADVLDGVVGHLELVAVRVDELAKRGLGGVSTVRGQRRERRGRGRGSGGIERRGNGRRVAVSCCRRRRGRGHHTTSGLALARSTAGCCGSHVGAGMRVYACLCVSACLPVCLSACLSRCHAHFFPALNPQSSYLSGLQRTRDER